VKKCRYCDKPFMPRRKHAKFCADNCRVAYHREKLEVVNTSDFHLFLTWRRLVGPVTRKEVELFARWRSRSRFLKHSSLTPRPVKKAEFAKATKAGKYNESKAHQNRSEDTLGDHGRLRTKRSHVRVVPGAASFSET
jgi:hypothetical protein